MSNRALREALSRLNPVDREVINFLTIEGRPATEIAPTLGHAPASVYVRYHRARERLRRSLPPHILEDLTE